MWLEGVWADESLFPFKTGEIKFDSEVRPFRLNLYKELKDFGDGLSFDLFTTFASFMHTRTHTHTHEVTHTQTRSDTHTHT